MIRQQVKQQGVVERVGWRFVAVLDDPVFGSFRVTGLTRRACKRKYGDLCGRLYLDQ